MKIWHRVSFEDDEEVTNRLDSLGIDYTEDIVFDIQEDDPRWPAVRSVVDKYDRITGSWTVFSATELRSASWLEMATTWHHGYPMPDDDFGYREETYDLAGYCRKCGIGMCQKGPFRMRGEPRWGKKSILQLNWVFDEIFVRPEVWATVFEPLGIGCWPVIFHRTERELRTVVQLRVDTVLEKELDMKDHAFEVCSECTRKKYLPFSRGMFPAMMERPEGIHAIKSKEWFGSGASAHRAFLVSQAVYKAIMETKLKGGHFTPLAQPDAR